MRTSTSYVLAIAAAAWVAAGVCPASEPLDRHGSFPSASPDGRQVVFASSRDAQIPPGQTGWLYTHIYAMRRDGSDVRQLTSGGTADTAPVFTPDGKWIVFGAYDRESRRQRLDVMRPDGSARHTILEADVLPWVRVSPDSRRVIFTWMKGDEPGGIATANIDGSDRREVNTGLEKAWDGIYSPDGKRLIFSRYPPRTEDAGGRPTQVYIANADGSERRLLATYPDLIQVPSFSPDGRSVAYQTYTGKKGEADIVILDAARGTFRVVSHRDAAYLDECPWWTPDGKLLFQSTRTGRFEVYAMDADGSKVQALTK